MNVNLYTRYRFATLRKTKHGSAKRLVSQYAPLVDAAVADLPLGYRLRTHTGIRVDLGLHLQPSPS